MVSLRVTDRFKDEDFEKDTLFSDDMNKIGSNASGRQPLLGAPNVDFCEVKIDPDKTYGNEYKLSLI